MGLDSLLCMSEEYVCHVDRGKGSLRGEYVLITFVSHDPAGMVEACWAGVGCIPFLNTPSHNGTGVRISATLVALYLCSASFICRTCLK